MIIKYSLNFILGTSSVAMNLMLFAKWGQYWLSYAAQIDRASSQNYSNLSVSMTVFQALKPLPHFTCHFLHYLYLKSISLQSLTLSGTFFCLKLNLLVWACNYNWSRTLERKSGQILGNHWTWWVFQENFKQIILTLEIPLCIY